MKDLKTRILDRFQLTHIEREIEGMKVFIKQLSDAETEAYQFARINPKTGEVDFSKVKGARSELVAMCLCNEDGSPVFKNGKEVGTSLPSEFVNAAYSVCAETNNMSGDADDAKKD